MPTETDPTSSGKETRFVGDEVAHVLSFALLMAHDLGLDPAKLLAAKLAKNEQRYPVDKSRGRSSKYDNL